MQKILFLILVFVVFGGGYLIFNEKQNQENNIIRNQNPIAENNTKKVAFSEFIKDGGSYQCNVKDYLSDVESGGTVYIDKDRMSGEFRTIAEGKQMNTSVLVLEGNTYMWSAGEDSGVVVSNRGELSSTYVWRPEEVGEYDCSLWEMDESKFTIPQNITFTKIAS